MCFVIPKPLMIAEYVRLGLSLAYVGGPLLIRQFCARDLRACWQCALLDQDSVKP